MNQIRFKTLSKKKRGKMISLLFDLIQFESDKGQRRVIKYQEQKKKQEKIRTSSSVEEQHFSSEGRRFNSYLVH